MLRLITPLRILVIEQCNNPKLVYMKNIFLGKEKIEEPLNTRNVRA